MWSMFSAVACALLWFTIQYKQAFQERKAFGIFMLKSTDVCTHQRDNTHDERCQLEENGLQMKNLRIGSGESRCEI